MRSPGHMRAWMAVGVLSALSVPSVEELVTIAEEAEGWEFEPCRYWPLPPGLVRVSPQEVAELGIPLRSLRGWTGLESRFEYVDRRCLKRYRRKAGRRV